MAYTGTTPPEGYTGILRRAGKMNIIPGRMEWAKYEIVNEGLVKACVVANPSGPAIPVPNTRPLLCRPTIIIGQEEAQWLETLLNEGKKVQTKMISVSQYLPGLKSLNVIGLIEAPSEDILLITAHIDSVPESPGAVDNASGVEGMLRVAERLLNSEPEGGWPFKIAFVGFGCEEWYLLGSTYYLFEAMDQGIHKNIKMCINLDMIGQGEKITFRIGTELLRKQFSLWFKQSRFSNYDIITDVPYASTDYWPFFYQGIPGIDILVLPYKYYHQPLDTFDCIELAQIEIISEMISEFIYWSATQS